MAWRVELSEEADRELSKLDAQHRKRILRFPSREPWEGLSDAARIVQLGYALVIPETLGSDTKIDEEIRVIRISVVFSHRSSLWAVLFPDKLALVWGT